MSPELSQISRCDKGNYNTLLNASVERVYSSHNMEHLNENEVPVALSEFYRVLKPGGQVVIEVPDVQSVAEAIPRVGLHGVLYQSPAGPISPADVLYGLRSAVAAGNHFYAHKSGFTKATLEEALTKARYRNVVVTRNADCYALHAAATRP